MALERVLFSLHRSFSQTYDSSPLSLTYAIAVVTFLDWDMEFGILYFFFLRSRHRFADKGMVMGMAYSHDQESHGWRWDRIMGEDWFLCVKVNLYDF